MHTTYHTITQDHLIRMKEMMSIELLIEYDWKRLFMTSKNKAIPENANNQIMTYTRLEMLQIDTY